MTPTRTPPLALDRIATLERQLAHASQLLEQHARLTLSDELVKAGLGPLVLDARRREGGDARGGDGQIATMRAGAHADADADAEVAKAAPETAAPTSDPTAPAGAAAVDLGPLILRALEIRKRVHAGSVSDEQAGADLEGMVEEHKLSEEQAATLRAWAGR